ncbi:hypothetical protein BJ508DRAFT_313358 [Ascobolus immersus RN42]|uniref:Uncharacterized protein n=1 Tax=Ascobolus immersus RN42 TaxID=1160509 RepID=A0A3N4HJ54_ASCIM|nr:hypothetical protein BJ508DRAFT_313358 [Ascobolus immersus RN42]
MASIHNHPLIRIPLGRQTLYIKGSDGLFPLFFCPLNTCQTSEYPPAFADKENMQAHLVGQHIWLWDLSVTPVDLEDVMFHSLMDETAFLVDEDKTQTNNVDEDAASNTAYVAGNGDHGAPQPLQEDPPQYGAVARERHQAGQTSNEELELEEAQKELKAIMRKNIVNLMNVTLGRVIKDGPHQAYEGGRFNLSREQLEELQSQKIVWSIWAESFAAVKNTKTVSVKGMLW